MVSKKLNKSRKKDIEIMYYEHGSPIEEIASHMSVSEEYIRGIINGDM